VVKSDGSVWFSDPTYGIDGEYEGDAAPSELGQSNIYRLDPRTGTLASSHQAFKTDHAIPFKVCGTQYADRSSALYPCATHFKNQVPPRNKVLDIQTNVQAARFKCRHKFIPNPGLVGFRPSVVTKTS
jgi:sugar lactone lactonase YvrE